MTARTPPVPASRAEGAREFAARVLRAVGRIPAGRVATYGDIAALAGRPKGARAVGRILARASQAGLPYHRVVSAGGALGGYGGTPAIKAALLVAEGATIRRGRIVGFAASRWNPRRTV